MRLNTEIILISFCQHIKSLPRMEATFHFNGHYLGVKITKIVVCSEKLPFFEKGEEYLLKLNVLKIQTQTLYCQCLQQKKLWQ